MQLGISINQMCIFPDEAILIYSNYGYVPPCHAVSNKFACDRSSRLGGMSWHSHSLAGFTPTSTYFISVSFCFSCDKMLFKGCTRVAQQIPVRKVEFLSEM